MKYLRPFWLALGFLTTLPVPRLGEVKPGEMKAASAYYPLVGWIIGALLAAAAWLLHTQPAGLAAALLLALWLLLTGMLHLDGLLDSADALLAMKPVEERLRILGDVHHGSFAVGAGFVHLLLKWQLLSLVDWRAVLLAPVVARFWVLPALNLFPSARPEGLGATARQGLLLPAVLIALPAAILAPSPFFLSGAFVLLTAWWASRRLGGGLSGDVYGALIELGETAVLFLFVYQ
ncbi:adenosylcobinamide-GDP ribazoletransferase [Oceanithermus sp.]